MDQAAYHLLRDILSPELPAVLRGKIVGGRSLARMGRPMVNAMGDVVRAAFIENGERKIETHATC